MKHSVPEDIYDYSYNPKRKVSPKNSCNHVHGQFFWGMVTVTAPVPGYRVFQKNTGYIYPSPQSHTLSFENFNGRHIWSIASSLESSIGPRPTRTFPKLCSFLKPFLYRFLLRLPYFWKHSRRISRKYTSRGREQCKISVRTGGANLFFSIRYKRVRRVRPV